MFTRWKNKSEEKTTKHNFFFLSIFFSSLLFVLLSDLLGGKEKKEGGPLIECPNSMCEHVRACVMSRSSALCRHFVVGTMTGCPALRDSSFSYVCGGVVWCVCVCCVCEMLWHGKKLFRSGKSHKHPALAVPYSTNVMPSKEKSQKEMKKKKTKILLSRCGCLLLLSVQQQQQSVILLKEIKLHCLMGGVEI